MSSRFTVYVRRLRSLPVYILSFISHARRNGLAAALVKSYQYLLWDSGRGYEHNFRRWFNRNNVQGNTAAAATVFARPSLLIVGALDLPQCRKYRVIQKAEMLQGLGIECRVSHIQDTVRVFNLMQEATHLMLYRVAQSTQAEAYIAEARRLGLRIIYDIDDPIFDRRVYADNRNLETLEPGEREALLQSSEQYLEVMRQCEFCTVSTSAMAELVAGHLPLETFIWRNAVDAESALLAEQARAAAESTGDGPLIAYMSGSRAHDRDFDSIAEVLAQLLGRHEELRLMLVGYVQLPQSLTAFSERIEIVPFGNYFEYFAALARADLTVVPLLHDSFNECKSAIRYFEAALLGLPTVASGVGQFREVIEHGVDGYLAETPEQWLELLEQLLQQPELRRSVGERAREAVSQQQSLPAVAEQLGDFLQACQLQGPVHE
ncbi:MAG: glycosyltransferase [Halieaceae bacterium]